MGLISRAGRLDGGSVHRRLVRVALGCLALGGLACRAPAPAEVTVADSAGVRITLSPDVPHTYAVVDTTPDLSLGSADAVGPTQFASIQGVYVDRRGNLWVADGQSREVRLFRPDGSHFKTVGGPGEGPGEFRSVRLLGRFRGDSVAVWDDAQGRLTVLDPDGNVARIAAYHGEDRSPPNGFRVFADGSVLARIRPVLEAGSLEPGALIPDTAIFARVDYATDTRAPAGGAPAPKWLWTGRGQIPVPFTVNPGFDVSGDVVQTTSGTAFRIRVFREGRLVESYGLDRDPAPVTAADRQNYADMVGGGATPRSEEYPAVLHDPHVPTELPAYRSLVVADDRTVWAERYSYGAFDVYGPDRVYLGRVEVPLQLTQVEGSRLVGIWRDALNVEHVRVHRFRRVSP